MRSTLYSIAGPWPGQLAILARPRGGDWLGDEVAGWKHAGIEIVVSALTPEEIDDTDLGQEQAEAQRQGLDVVAFPIPDRGTPASVTTSDRLLHQISQSLSAGRHVGVHCRQGIGRSSLITAALLILAGVGAEDAWQRITAARGCPVPDTEEQKAWVEQFARTRLAAMLDAPTL